ncbi:Disease resistance protein [Sesamum alatum]|uniref:Disease resistance protein n=1 Tax=Sesamum alatum TaxID=300844 RepID=A0AAE1XMC0_9LAMI|nr:Disease resistance protein [Sesamum alatum]
MEILASAVGALLVEPCRALFTLLRAKLKNPFHFTANLRDLDAEMEGLIQRRDQLSERLRLIATAGLQEPSGVRDWLGNVNTLEARVRALKQDLASGPTNSERSCCLRCSKLSDHVAIRLAEARQLTTDGEILDGVIGPDPSIVRTEHMPAPDIEDQATASRNMANVMALLSREDVKRIGIWGMGGVGKTTLVQNINNKLSGSNSFDIVMWITVSNRYPLETESELTKVQNLIAKRLKLELPEERLETRTSQLHARLMMEKTFLLILDDVWNPIDLDRLGIPEPCVHRGGRIILTTRSYDVCSQMSDVTLKIEALNEDEAWSLFCKSAGEVATWKEIEPLAKAITKECGGLPLAINVVGASLKRKRMVEVWKDALNALHRSEPPIGSGIENKVYNPIKWSYDLLPDECIKSCFLFCCLFPDDYEIDVERLVRYWLAEGLLMGHHDIEEVINRGITIIETLKDRSLLEEGGKFMPAVKMHDIIRDVSIWISSLTKKDKCRSLVRFRIGIHKMGEDELLVKSYTRVSFMCNEISELPDALEECPTVSTLLLQENHMLEHIPDVFLPAFKSLKILDLSNCHGIKSLPPCLDQLVELRALLLQSCKSLETLPPVGGLAKLEELVISHTSLAALPQETTDSLLNWMEKLAKFQFYIGAPNIEFRMSDRYSTNRVIFKDIHAWGERMEWLFAYTNCINFSCLDGLDTMFQKLVANSDEVGCFDTVVFLDISAYTGFFGVGRNAKLDMLPNLEKICLNYVTNLSCASTLASQLGLRFSKLRYIRVKQVPTAEIFSLPRHRHYNTLTGKAPRHLHRILRAGGRNLQA